MVRGLPDERDAVAAPDSDLERRVRRRAAVRVGHDVGGVRDPGPPGRARELPLRRERECAVCGAAFQPTARRGDEGAPRRERLASDHVLRLKRHRPACRRASGGALPETVGRRHALEPERRLGSGQTAESRLHDPIDACERGRVDRVDVEHAGDHVPGQEVPAEARVIRSGGIGNQRLRPVVVDESETEPARCVSPDGLQLEELGRCDGGRAAGLADARLHRHGNPGEQDRPCQCSGNGEPRPPRTARERCRSGDHGACDRERGHLVGLGRVVDPRARRDVERAAGDDQEDRGQREPPVPERHEHPDAGERRGRRHRDLRGADVDVGHAEVGSDPRAERREFVDRPREVASIRHERGRIARRSRRRAREIEGTPQLRQDGDDAGCDGHGGEREAPAKRDAPDHGESDHREHGRRAEIDADRRGVDDHGRRRGDPRHRGQP